MSRDISPKQNACRRCGGFGTVSYRRLYSADTVQVSCPDCRPGPAPMGRATSAELEHQKAISAKATEVANALNGGPPTKCHGRKSDRWQLCWDAALMALGGDPALYRGHERPWPDNPAFYQREATR